MTQMKSAFQSKGTFKIEVGPETIKMLSSELYSDPIKAMVREYSTNAKDSHVDAKNGQPFDVHLPTSAYPMFYVRDYGTGMSRELIETVCQTYGASTKRETNQSTGKFGLGFKSALAYVNTFSVMSYLNGTVYRYMVKTGDNGMPELLYDNNPEKTDEPNGVKIQFAVDAKDVRAFIVAAKSVYPFFEIPPNFVGDITPDIEPPVYLAGGVEDTFTWRICEDDSESMIIMGSNAYPMPVPAIEEFKDDLIHYYVEMDLFEPTPAREALRWPSEDVDRIKEMRQIVVQRLVAQFIEETKGMTSWERLRHHHSSPSKFVRTCCRNYVKSRYPNRIDLRTESFDIEFNTFDAMLRIAPKQVGVFGCVGSPIRRRRYLRGGDKKYTSAGYFCIERKMAHVDKDHPVSLLVYDVKGINSMLEHIPNHTLVLGKPGQTYDPKWMDGLTAVFDAEKIPYEVLHLSEIIAAHPKRLTQSSVNRSKPDPNACVGAFDLVNGIFTRTTDITQFTHYIEFDDETTFSVRNTFRGLGGCSHTEGLNQTSYEEVADALGMPHKGITMCYIRPRFVKDYATNLKSWAKLSKEYFKKKFTDDWMNFMVILNNHDAWRELSCESIELLKMYEDITNAWAFRAIKYPLAAQILETLIEHRFRAGNFSRTAANKDQYIWLEQSTAASKAIEEYNALTRWAFNSSAFCEIHKNWTQALNRETASMLRSYPYLFKHRNDLLYRSLITRSLHTSHINE